MTELSYRPGPRPRSRPARLVEDPRHSMPVAAALASVSAIAIGLGMCMAAALAGWFLAEAGAHGQATDALRIGADAWLSGHGVSIDAAAGPLGITPLGLTGILILIGHRSGHRLALTTARARNLRTLVPMLTVGCATYVVAALLVAISCTRADAEPRLLPTLIGSFAVGVLGLGTGLARGSGTLDVLAGRFPRRVRSVIEVAIAGACLLLVAGTVLLLVGLTTSFTQVANLFTALDLTPGNAVMLLVVSALLVPNAALLGVAWLSGPGFAVGTGTSVTATAVTLGPLPAFPLLGALPASGAGPNWIGIVFAVPGLCALVAAGLAQSRYGDLAWDSSAVRGFLGGLLGAVAVWSAMSVAGGPMGTGRMADIGADAGATLVMLTAAMSVGGLIGGLGVTAVQRRRASRKGC